MTGQKLSDWMQDSQRVTVHADCCGCDMPVTITLERIAPDQIRVDGGAMFKPPESWHEPDEFLFKCNGCFRDNPQFGMRTEVYSRVVGYMRPVSQWNGAKKSEFQMRKTFAIHPTEY